MNRNLLLDPLIRQSMTDKEKEMERSCNDYKIPRAVYKSDSVIVPTSDLSTSATTLDGVSSTQPSLNFSSGTSLFCLTSIVKKEQLIQARERGLKWIRKKVTKPLIN